MIRSNALNPTFCSAECGLSEIIIDLPSAHHTIQVGVQLAACLVAPLVITFQGEIGAGKTTFIRAMLHALGVSSAIKSPTFSLVESYHLPSWQIHHFDLYRIQDETELEYIGFREYFLANTICCIEWPERANHALGIIDLQFIFTIKPAGRTLRTQALNPKGDALLSRWATQMRHMRRQTNGESN